jgi:hypothetical protein
MKKEKIQWLSSAPCKIFLACLILAVGGWYIVKISAISATGYDLAALEEDIEELTRENQRLQFEIAKQQSMASIEARLPALQLVAVDGVEYLDAGGAIVARK